MIGTKFNNSMADGATVSIFVYFVAGTALLGSFKTVYDVWNILKEKCRPPERREVWDGDALPVHRVGGAVTAVLAQVADELMSLEIEVDPARRAAPFRASQ